MTKDEIHTGVRAIFRESFGDAKADAVTDDQAIFSEHGKSWEEGKLDSLDRTEFVMALEDTFGIEIPDVLMVAVVSIGQAVDLVSNLVGEPACGAH